MPGLTEGTFPNGKSGRAPSGSKAWLSELSAVPYPIRGDAESLPQWRFRSATTQKELTARFAEFRVEAGEHLLAEERRLAYVAFTRARSTLLLSGAAWGEGSTVRKPSRFLTEIADLALESAAGPVSGAEPGAGADTQATGARITVLGWHETADGAENPREERHRAIGWPLDPLAGRRAEVEDGAALVLSALAGLEADEPEEPDARERPEQGPAESADVEGWFREVDLLLAERSAQRSGARDVALPAQLSASRLVQLARDPQALAQTLRRPLPKEPTAATRRGSTFHAWLEKYFADAALIDLDDLPGAYDEVIVDADLARLQERFMVSPWSRRMPYAVEVSVETPVADIMARGRIDAVFRVDAAGADTAAFEGLNDPDDERWQLVDWKTGAPPADPADRAAAAVQLAVYRLAWAELRGIDPARVSAAFYYASTGSTVAPVDLLDASGLAGLIEHALTPGRV